MKLVTWNVNGLRGCATKGFWDYYEASDADIFCIQESKMQPDQWEFDVDNRHIIIHSALKKGYSGTIVIAKKEPLSTTLDFGDDEFSGEGRVITCEYDDFYLVNVYVPNSKEGLARMPYRLLFEAKMRNYLMTLDKIKPVILCGDLNVAHNEIDLKNPKTNRKNAGFSDEERDAFSQLLACGFTDVFRSLFPERIEYTWWSYRFQSRLKNAGWRIDYFITSNRLFKQIKEITIRNDIHGSDHCPVEMIID